MVMFFSAYWYGKGGQMGVKMYTDLEGGHGVRYLMNLEFGVSQPGC